MDSARGIGQKVYPNTGANKSSKYIALSWAKILKIILDVVIPTLYVILSFVYFVYYFMVVGKK